MPRSRYPAPPESLRDLGEDAFDYLQEQHDLLYGPGNSGDGQLDGDNLAVTGGGAMRVNEDHTLSVGKMELSDITTDLSGPGALKAEGGSVTQSRIEVDAIEPGPKGQLLRTMQTPSGPAVQWERDLQTGASNALTFETRQNHPPPPQSGAAPFARDENGDVIVDGVSGDAYHEPSFSDDVRMYTKKDEVTGATRLYIQITEGMQLTPSYYWSNPPRDRLQFPRTISIDLESNKDAEIDTGLNGVKDVKYWELEKGGWPR